MPILRSVSQISDKLKRYLSANALFSAGVSKETPRTTAPFLSYSGLRSRNPQPSAVHPGVSAFGKDDGLPGEVRQPHGLAVVIAAHEVGRLVSWREHVASSVRGGRHEQRSSLVRRYHGSVTETLDWTGLAREEAPEPRPIHHARIGASTRLVLSTGLI